MKPSSSPRATPKDAHRRGLKDYDRGVSFYSCPYSDAGLVAAWERAWRLAHDRKGKR